MTDIAVGRKEIMKVLHVGSWRTVQRYKNLRPGFSSLFRRDPLSNKPVIIAKEYVDYLIEWNKLTEKQK
jgi:hypothetical protein